MKERVTGDAQNSGDRVVGFDSRVPARGRRARRGEAYQHEQEGHEQVGENR